MRNATSWLQHIPKHWEVKRLKDICEFRNGYTPSKDVSAFWENGTIPWYRMEDIRLSGRVLNKAQQYITEEAVKTGGLFEADSFILATTATIGEHARLIADSLANQQFTNLKIRKSLKNNSLVNYFSYFLYVVDDFCKANIHFSTFPAVDMFELVAMPIPLPPLAEQEKIARYLDEKVGQIDTKVSLIEKKIERYQLLKKSIINQIVTRGLNPNAPIKNSQISWLGQIPEHWEVKRLKDITYLNPVFTGTDLEGDVSFVPMESLRYDCISPSVIDFKEAKGKYTYFSNNDLLIAKVTPCFENGNVAIAYDLVQNVGFGSSEIFVLRINNEINNRYLFYIVRTNSFIAEACSTMCGVGGLKRISPLFMRTANIPIPPLSEQQQIASYLDQKCAEIDAVISNCTAQIEKYKTLKRALINEVVTGQRK